MQNSKKGADHKKLVSRVSKIEGQVRGISKMISDQKYCVDILTQIKAAKSALKSLELQIVDGHAKHCLHKAMESNSKDESHEMLEELIEIFKKIN